MPNDILLHLYNSVLTQPSLEKPFPTKDKNYKDTQLKNEQRLRDLVTFNPKWNVFIKSLPSWLRELCKRGGWKECKSQRGWMIRRKQYLPDKTGLVVA